MIRKSLEKMVRFLLKKLIRVLKRPNIMYDHEGGEAYLSRYFLFRGPKSADGSNPYDEFGRPKSNIVRTNKWSFVLHHFHKSDSTTKLHDHGWTWGLSFMLAGGYMEEKLVDGKVITKKVKAFTFNFIRPNEFHRVELIEKDAWSLFFCGPRTKEWNYKDRKTFKIIPWKKHLKTAN